MTSLLDQVRSARSFAADRFVPLEAGGRIGWIRRDRVAGLDRWPEIFAIEEGAVRLQAHLASEAARSAALGEVALRLAKQGAISGWRHETYAIRVRLRDKPLFHLERAAMRFFGLTSQAAHLNGFVRSDRGLRLWMGRRRPTKEIDPGRLDTLVGGGIPSGQDARQTLVRECFEGAGIEPALAKRAKPAGMLEICNEEPAGLHSEILHAHDLELAADFRPRNVDGEVAEFHCLAASEVADRIANGEFTVDAGLLTLDFLARNGAIAFTPELLAALDQCRVRP